MSARLALRRLLVRRGGKPLYDEKYHDGVNVIRGANGSGKSSIADFIFFALGGDLREWRKHAQAADEVYAEIEAKAATLTLRRDCSPESGRPMDIFFGGLEAAIAAPVTEWKAFPYKRSDAGMSFSQVIFKAAGIPEAISDGTSNVTMHQLLRLLYSDQMTPIQRIFREQQFDTWQTRQAVGDVLCGVGGYDLFGLQIEQRDRERSYAEVESDLRSLHAIAAGFGKNVLPEHLSAAVANAQTDRAQLLERIAAVGETDGGDAEAKAAARLREDHRKQLLRAQRHLGDLETKYETLEFEIEDAERFMQHLRSSLSEFNSASTTFFALGAARFEFCPSCFAVVADAHDPSLCHLCGSSIAHTTAEEKVLAVKLDLEMQLRESLALQTDRHEHLRAVGRELRTARGTMATLESADTLTRATPATSMDAARLELSRRVGFLDREIEALEQRGEIVSEIARLSARKAELNDTISALKAKIAAIIRSQLKRKLQTATAISTLAKSLLDRDLAEHSDFGEVKTVSFDFAGDWIAINSDKNRARSASGMVILKNSFLVGLWLASLKDERFNLPRFLLLDNIEDKGMVEERSRNFQRLIAAESAAEKTPHQIIFTTSMVAPELDNDKFAVGRKYTKQDKSLEFAKGDEIPDTDGDELPEV
jgi:hypothetical protein